MTREGLKENYKKQARTLIAFLKEIKAELQEPLYNLWVSVELINEMTTEQDEVNDSWDMELQGIWQELEDLTEHMFDPDMETALNREELEEWEE